jgi:hypothetical protein
VNVKQARELGVNSFEIDRTTACLSIPVTLREANANRNRFGVVFKARYEDVVKRAAG